MLFYILAKISFSLSNINQNIDCLIQSADIRVTPKTSMAVLEDANKVFRFLQSLWANHQYIRITTYVLFTVVIIYISLTLFLLFKLLLTSKYLKQLRLINKNTTYHKIVDPTFEIYSFNNKRNLDNSEPEAVLYKVIFDGQNPFSDMITKSNENKDFLELYNQNVNAIYVDFENSGSTISIKTPIKSYGYFLEKIIFKRSILESPVVNPRFIFKLEYLSPQGRNYYFKDSLFSKEDINKMVHEATEERKKQSSDKHLKLIERRKLNDSMRFKILKRDGYKCQLCGKTAKSGAVLHVDHKVPIAKGGTTIESNLWVLCDRCNLGKGTRRL
jgi:hypothetical protein